MPGEADPEAAPAATRTKGPTMTDAEQPDEPPRLLHRDDVPYEIAEEAVRRLQEQFPGFTVRFAGDAPDELSPEVLAELKQFEQVQQELFYTGRCGKCREQMPGWDDITVKMKSDDDDWELPDGWVFWCDMTETPIAWECPACDDG